MKAFGAFRRTTWITPAGKYVTGRATFFPIVLNLMTFSDRWMTIHMIDLGSLTGKNKNHSLCDHITYFAYVILIFQKGKTAEGKVLKQDAGSIRDPTLSRQLSIFPLIIGS